MKYMKSITILVLVVVVLSLIATLTGLFSNQGPGEHDFTSLSGQKITLYGRGIYSNNSVSAALQAIPQDVVTLVIGIPMLLIGLILAKKNLYKGKLLLTGVLGYFLITYMMYTFIAMYNRLFLVYVLLMSASFFSFTLSLMSFDIEKSSKYYNSKFPIRFVGGFLTASTVIIGLLWLSRVVPTIINDSVPLEVEHGTTLTVQAFDLAFFLPAIFMSGYLLIKKRYFGFTLAPIVTVSETMVMIALLSKAISMTLAGMAGTMPMLVMMSLFAVLGIAATISVLKNVVEPERA